MDNLIEHLETRSIIRVGGEDAEHFLENLVTCSVVDLDDGEARFGALLTPQGKILFDFFLIKMGDQFLLDVHSDSAEAFQKRLMFYRLRAKVNIEADPEMQVLCASGSDPAGSIVTVADPRHPDLPKRCYGQFDTSNSSEFYDQKRIGIGVPEGNSDFEYGDAYPHETLMDQFGGVDFKKGCYVGQEVVSRMQHRGTAKKRIVRVTGDAPLPENSSDVLADGKPAGTLGSVDGSSGLALLRLDRVSKADTVTIDGTVVTAEIQDWVNFSWPE